MTQKNPWLLFSALLLVLSARTATAQEKQLLPTPSALLPPEWSLTHGAPAAAPTQLATVTKIYSVADLVVPKGVDGKKTCEDVLIRLITNHVKPSSWEAKGCGSIDFFPLGTALVVTQTPEVQEQIADLLASLRLLRETQAVAHQAADSKCQSCGFQCCQKNEPVYHVRMKLFHVAPDGTRSLEMQPEMIVAGNQEGSLSLASAAAPQVCPAGCFTIGIGVNSHAGLTGSLVLDSTCNLVKKETEPRVQKTVRVKVQPAGDDHIKLDVCLNSDQPAHPCGAGTMQSHTTLNAQQTTQLGKTVELDFTSEKKDGYLLELAVASVKTQANLQAAVHADLIANPSAPGQPMPLPCSLDSVLACLATTSTRMLAGKGILQTSPPVIMMVSESGAMDPCAAVGTGAALLLGNKLAGPLLGELVPALSLVVPDLIDQMASKSASSNERMMALIQQSEDLRQNEYAWSRHWFRDQPSHLTPDQIDGPESSWNLEWVKKNGKAELQIDNGSGTQIHCQEMEMSLPGQHEVKCAAGSNQVVVRAGSFEGMANRVRASTQGDTLIFEGNVQINHQQDGTAAKVSAEKVVLSLADDSLTVQTRGSLKVRTRAATSSSYMQPTAHE